VGATVLTGTVSVVIKLSPVCSPASPERCWQPAAHMMPAVNTGRNIFIDDVLVFNLKQYSKYIILESLKCNLTMTIREAQEKIDSWINTTGVRYFSELTNMAILTEEVGEVARIMARQYGDQSSKDSDKKKDLADELADVMWVLLCIANQTGIDMTVALEKNFEKKNIRDATRHQQNEKLK
jgi:NTP pyrophosphatase (non-canonical NTP hydrolase)